MGGIILDPPSDNWTRTIYVENKSKSTGAKWVEVANTVAVGLLEKFKGSKLSIKILSLIIIEKN